MLIVEVSHTTAWQDHSVKVPLYARHGIAEVWLVDLNQPQLHILRKPTGTGYAYSFPTATPGVTPISTLPGVTVNLSQLLELC